jgi:hypothetical protein
LSRLQKAARPNDGKNFMGIPYREASPGAENAIRISVWLRGKYNFHVSNAQGLLVDKYSTNVDMTWFSVIEIL